ncbi:MAG: DUF1993 domain-containing protein [Pseudomonadota bacterium]|nr:DUF1993 domain-containing protein [Pseudomonadota bacterium]
MALSMHEIALPVFRQQFGALGEILDQTRTHAEARELDPAIYLEARLSPDMFTRAAQVRQATDHVQRCIAKLTDTDELSFDVEEETIDYWQGRINTTRDYMEAAPPEKFEGTEDKPIELVTRVRTMHFPGRHYVLHFVFPQFLFHVTTAYDIARGAGVPLGKRHYLGNIPQSV